MKSRIEIPAGVLMGKPRHAFLELKRNRVTASIRWDVGTIDCVAAASDEFSDRLQKAGMIEAISRLFRDEKFKNWYLLGGVRWGTARKIHLQDFEKLVALVKRFYTEAATNLPDDLDLTSVPPPGNRLPQVQNGDIAATAPARSVGPARPLTGPSGTPNHARPGTLTEEPTQLSPTAAPAA